MKVPPFKRRSDGLESEALIILKPSKSTFRPFGIFPISKVCPFRRFLHTLVVLKTQNANGYDSDSLKVGTIFYGLARSGPNQIKLRKIIHKLQLFLKLSKITSDWINFMLANILKILKTMKYKQNPLFHYQESSVNLWMQFLMVFFTIFLQIKYYCPWNQIRAYLTTSGAIWKEKGPEKDILHGKYVRWFGKYTLITLITMRLQIHLFFLQFLIGSRSAFG